MPLIKMNHLIFSESLNDMRRSVGDLVVEHIAIDVAMVCSEQRETSLDHR